MIVAKKISSSLNCADRIGESVPFCMVRVLVCHGHSERHSIFMDFYFLLLMLIAFKR